MSDHYKQFFSAMLMHDEIEADLDMNMTFPLLCIICLFELPI